MKLLLTLMLGLPLVAFGQAKFVITPNNLVDRYGNSGDSTPFDLGNANGRYQQVFAASQFSDLGSSGWLLRKLSFRVDDSYPVGGGRFDTTLPSLQINFSTTSKEPDQLSSTFAENIGSDEAIGYSRGPLSISGFRAFANSWLFIQLDQPFFYNPAAGNLLMEVRNFGGGRTAAFDAESSVGDSVSQVWSRSDLASGSVDSSTGIVDTRGLVTGFVFFPVPEPSTWALLGLGGVMAGVTFWRRQPW